MRWQGGGRSATAISQGTRGLPAAARRGGTRKGRDPPTTAFAGSRTRLPAPGARRGEGRGFCCYPVCDLLTAALGQGPARFCQTTKGGGGDDPGHESRFVGKGSHSP